MTDLAHSFIQRRSVRLISKATIVSLLATSVPVQALPAPAPAEPAVPETAVPASPPPVMVNRSVPAVPPAPLMPDFSLQATEAEIRSARVFAEPLVPVGGEPSPEENAALAATITRPWRPRTSPRPRSRCPP